GSEATAQDRARGVRRHRARSRRGPGRRRPERHVGVVLTGRRPHRHLRAQDATRSRPAGRLGPADRRRARYQTGVSLLLRGLRGLEADLVVGAVAHRLVAGLAAAAERDSRLARRVDLSPGRIDQLALALDQIRTVRPGRDLDGHRVSPPWEMEQRPPRYHHASAGGAPSPATACSAQARGTLFDVKEPGAILLIACYELGHQPLAVAWPAAFLEREGYAPAVMDVSVEPFDAERVRRAKLVAISVPMHTALRLGVTVAWRV